MPRLRFPLRPLPGRRERAGRPALPIEVRASGILIPVPIVGLVDTGAPYTILPADLARQFGIRAGRARRVNVVVAGWRGRLPLVRGFIFRIRGVDLDAGGEEVAVELPAEALLLSEPSFLDFVLLGQVGFLDRIEEFSIRQRERFFEIMVGGAEPADESAAHRPEPRVRERTPRYRRRRR